jgi:hypothetical protein
MPKPTKPIEKIPQRPFYAVVEAASGIVLYCGRFANKAGAAWVKGSYWGSGPSKDEAIQSAKSKVPKITDQ